jgi:hypothetical protein
MAHPPQTKETFYKNVIKQSNGCWEWQKSLHTFGYGVTSYKNKYWGAHRLSLVFEGIDPTGYYVCHSCDNPKCVNPAHLFLGTHNDNMKDMRKKNRDPKGSQCNKSNLTDQDILDIRQAKENGVTGIELSKKYKVSAPSIYNICNKKTWTHI